MQLHGVKVAAENEEAIGQTYPKVAYEDGWDFANAVHSSEGEGDTQSVASCVRVHVYGCVCQNGEYHIKHQVYPLLG